MSSPYAASPPSTRPVQPVRHEEAQRQRAVTLVNPLPVALAHYEAALRSTLSAVGADVVGTHTPSAEVGGGPLATSLRAALDLSVSAMQVVRSHPEDLLLSLWPAFGLADPVRWPRSASVWHVVHDPRPLRRQAGYGNLSARLGRSRLGSPPRVLVHSSVAADELARRGWPMPLVVPHPICPAPGPEPRADRDGVLVLGQYKPVRDLVALDLLAQQLAGRLKLSVHGRGWPALPGWEVSPGFLCEDEFDDRLRSAGCLVLPYRRYFVSGVAVRAVERLTPVVASRHPMLEDLLGRDWPGFVEGDRWAAAVGRVADLEPARLVAVRASYAERAQAAWTEWLSMARSWPTGPGAR